MLDRHPSPSRSWSSLQIPLTACVAYPANLIGDPRSISHEAAEWEVCLMGAGTLPGLRWAALAGAKLMYARREAAAAPQARSGCSSYCCICISWLIEAILWFMCSITQSEPNTTRQTMRTPKASASTLLALSGDVVM
jgi:hypothetical protein